ncbi:MAG: ATP-binding cassette domain-containing protein [Mycoplasma sp.]
MQIKHLITIEHLYAIYNFKDTNSFVALKDFNYKFESQKVYCIIGESGSGKSTLINFFNGLSKPIYGDVKINGIELNSKKYLHNIFLKKMKLHNESLQNLFKVNKSLFEKNNTFLVQVANDASPTEVELAIKQFEPSLEPTFIKLKLKDYFVYNINPNTKSKFYIIGINNPLNHIHTVKSSNEFGPTDVSCKSQKKDLGRKIKNFKVIRKDVGMVYQFPEYQLFKNTVIEDVMFGPRNLGFKKDEAREVAKKSLLKLNMSEDYFENSPFSLSGGQKRRVAIAGILSIGGDILIFDEPTAGLDPKGEHEMLTIIKNAKREKKTIFIVTHSMSHVLEIADEVLVLHNGELIKSGSPYEIFYDKKIINKTNIEIPYVIKVVQKLIKKDNIYSKLLETKPRDVNELARDIIKIKKGVKND